MNRTVTVDFQERLDDIGDRLDHVNAIEAFIDGDDDVDVNEHLEALDFDPIDADGWDDVSDEAKETLRAEADDLRRRFERAQKVGEDHVKKWSGSQFEIKELTWGDQAMRNDLATGDMLQSEYSDPRANQDAVKLRTVQVATVETPPDAPDNPREYPPVVGEWLHEKIDNLNTYGEVTMDDFSDSGQTPGEN